MTESLEIALKMTKILAAKDRMSLKFLRLTDYVSESCLGPGCCGCTRVEGCRTIKDCDRSRSNCLPRRDW